MRLALAAFWVMALLVFSPRAGRARLRERTRREWVLDLVGLGVQGWAIPLSSAYALAPLLEALAPSHARMLELPAAVGFLLGFVVVDYLYYWNHRLFHATRLWSLHRVHHTLSAMDLLGTSRNSVWSSFFIVYLWTTALARYALADPVPYELAITLTVILDLWRHSGLELPPALARIVGAVLVLPRDHAWHHAGDGRHGNYGANLILWDRLHGTRHRAEGPPSELGIPPGGSLTDELLRPWALS